MDEDTLSPKYRVVIPHSVRRRLRLRPGERLQVISFGDRIAFVRVRPMPGMRGFLKGLDPSFRRDGDRR